MKEDHDDSSMLGMMVCFAGITESWLNLDQNFLASIDSVVSSASYQLLDTYSDELGKDFKFEKQAAFA